MAVWAWARRIWRGLAVGSTVAWIWSLGAGLVALVLAALADLGLVYQVLAFVGVMLLVLASILSFSPTYRPVLAGGDAPFDASKWVAGWGGSLVRVDMNPGHFFQAETGEMLLWISAPDDEPIDPLLWCRVTTPSGQVLRSPRVNQYGGPTAPGQSQRNGVDNTDYVIELPKQFSPPVALETGDYSVEWLSGETLLRVDHFPFKR